jgi:adenylate cyclase
MESTSIAISALLAGLAALLWFGRNSGWKFFLFVLFEVTLLVGGTYALWQGKVVGTGSLMAAMLLAFLSRLVWESIRHYREKSLLRSAFAGHVSPQVMRAILNGKLQPDGEGEVCKATMLFADIRGFTTRSESSTPEATIALLNQYYAETSAAIHGKGGAIDKFIGDGLMATFGVPQPLNNPARSALEAAQDMLVRIARLNKNLEAQGLAPIEIGIGIHSGDVIAGYVGSRKRRDFTVIGDAVNTASRLESMTKNLGYPVVCSNAIALAVGHTGGLVDLGEQSVKGRSALHVWGWNPPLVQRIQKDGL